MLVRYTPDSWRYKILNIGLGVGLHLIHCSSA